ncbi:MAG: DUF4038 domain-containing protein [Bacteroidetes bacterium]|nr:DUF4038 domain-containing protein [Bacteroidota bacterium]MDA1120058.1 DUF4038 domain-containing protein [Bacteroidota bacterium]
MMNKNISIFLVVLLNCSFVMAQNEYEPTSINPYGMPNPKAPSEIKDFQPLIGKCDCLSYLADNKGNWLPAVKMTWEFKYGEFLGSRYKNEQNIIWIVTGHTDPDNYNKNIQTRPIHRSMAEGIVKGVTGNDLERSAIATWFDPSSGNTATAGNFQ